MSVCGFCGIGIEAECFCGPLHTEGKCSAHKKCMQYSALLKQYNFRHFGGFKVTKVQQEVSRGRYLKCSLCAKDKKSKMKKGGATSGCAVKKCRKSFHFLCATKKKLTRRIVMRDGVVKYRTFCCKEHEDEYKKTSLDDFKYESESEEDDDLPMYASDTSSSSDDNTSGTYSEDEVPAKNPSPAAKPLAKSTPKSTPIKGKPKHKQVSRFLTRDDSMSSSTSVSSTTTGSKRVIGTITYSDEERARKKRKHVFEDCILCICEGLIDDEVRSVLERAADKLHGFAPDKVFIWDWVYRSCQGIISTEHVPYIMKDVTKALSHADFTEMNRILFDVKENDVVEYDSVLHFNKDLGEELEEKVVRKMRESVKENLKEAKESLKVEVGTICFLKKIKRHALFLIISNATDPNSIIREHLQFKDELFFWNKNTKVCSKSIIKYSEAFEIQVICDWLTHRLGPNFAVYSMPKDEMLLDSDQSTCTYFLERYFVDRSIQANTGSTNLLIFLFKLDKDICNFKAFLRKCLRFLSANMSSLDANLYCVFDYDVHHGIFSMKDIYPECPPTVQLKVLTATDPSSVTPSCVVLHLTLVPEKNGDILMGAAREPSIATPSSSHSTDIKLNNRKSLTKRRRQSNPSSPSTVEYNAKPKPRTTLNSVRRLKEEKMEEGSDADSESSNIADDKSDSSAKGTRRSNRAEGKSPVKEKSEVVEKSPGKGSVKGSPGSSPRMDIQSTPSPSHNAANKTKGDSPMEVSSPEQKSLRTSPRKQTRDTQSAADQEDSDSALEEKSNRSSRRTRDNKKTPASQEDSDSSSKYKSKVSSLRKQTKYNKKVTAEDSDSSPGGKSKVSFLRKRTKDRKEATASPENSDSSPGEKSKGSSLRKRTKDNKKVTASQDDSDYTSDVKSKRGSPRKNTNGNKKEVSDSSEEEISKRSTLRKRTDVIKKEVSDSSDDDKSKRSSPRKRTNEKKQTATQSNSDSSSEVTFKRSSPRKSLRTNKDGDSSSDEKCTPEPRRTSLRPRKEGDTASD